MIDLLNDEVYCNTAPNFYWFDIYEYLRHLFIFLKSKYNNLFILIHKTSFTCIMRVCVSNLQPGLLQYEQALAQDFCLGLWEDL